MKLLVTGGAGIIGSSLVQKLSLFPEISSITVYDNLSVDNSGFFFQTKLDKSKVKFIEGDILETRKIQKLVRDIDIVVHLAAIDSHSEESDAAHYMEQVNHWGTAELSYAIETSEVKKVIYTSSAGVYGYSEQVKTEKSELGPVSAFAHSKLRGEAHIVRLKSRTNSILFRLGTVLGIGPVTRIKGVANAFMWDTITKNRLSVNGNGKQVRPVATLDYIVNGVAKAVLEDIDSGVYNLVQSNVQVLDLLEELKKIRTELEFIFANHHLQLPSLHMATDFENIFPKPALNIAEEYSQMLQKAALN